MLAKNTKEVLDKFAKTTIKVARSNLTKSGKRDRGTLYKEMDYELKVSRNSIGLSFELADYWEFVDKGVKGKSSSSKAPNSPFKFGSGTGKKGGLTNAIDGWTKRKRIQFKDKKGKFISYKATAFIITRSIYQTGLKETQFFSKPFESQFNKLSNDVVEAFALDVDSFLKFSTK